MKEYSVPSGDVKWVFPSGKRELSCLAIRMISHNFSEVPMFCSHCGTEMSEAAGFCPSCGKQAGTQRLMPTQSRIAGHIRLLGIFWLALSAFRFIPGVILIWLFRPGMGVFADGDIPPFVHVLVTG